MRRAFFVYNDTDPREKYSGNITVVRWYSSGMSIFGCTFIHQAPTKRLSNLFNFSYHKIYTENIVHHNEREAPLGALSL
ncbi:hypothetical protein BAZ12_12400 [Elizabethkingia miricola]|uniref:Uncharacterized protein n=1 Tax=Elizabethkingia miricola TaxID=172045 RepID=A0ABD4DQ35_ELIMR|nr:MULTISPECIES: hypothetical protein [Elizabethkingia]KUY20746.1 hypothetical protein ATB95_07540 [Elizabethkingia miricola]MCL1653056.1 hypothetical protein [Elizabethkingia miricola]MDX8567468.1 hypothetical protein [Elizabethkingia sp. HX XZB]OPC36938.1 hypothetical protein BAX99_18240 [Elizabethkingia miricola]OPC70567.1 hypothetical protein BAZ12_12400 [Elizabethkingia miricola]